MADRSGSSREQEVIRFTKDGRSPETVALTEEVPLTVYYNGREIITLLTTPDHPLELAVGFLRSEGFLEEREDLMDMKCDPGKGVVLIEGRAGGALVEKLMEKRTVTSGCGKGTTFYHAQDALQTRVARGRFRIKLDRVVDLILQINRRAMKDRVSGGVHHAALASEEGPVVIMEDIGRHNAIDKIHGHCFLKGITLDDKFLMTTGRISSEILIKAAKMGVPMVVSLSKATDLALELAERLKITVVGNLRGRRGIIYKDFGRLE